MEITSIYSDEQAYNDLIKCSICPRSCNANRVAKPSGYCKSDSRFNISSICIHKGEEPVISGPVGICNIFFSHCNLQCIYCQNHQISQNGTKISQYGTLDQITETIINFLDKGCSSIGFVSATHMVPQMVLIINSLHRRGRYPIVVYNSNGYDSVDTLKRLEGLVDVYLPDFKYSNNNLGYSFSDVKDYKEIAIKALKEMCRQMGPKVITDKNEIAIRGLIIRHLVLPGEVENSINALRIISEELTSEVTISLMAQFHPVAKAIGHKTLGSTITVEEYASVVTAFEHMGFGNGWVQELESNKEYLPDFDWDHPFEKSA